VILGLDRPVWQRKLLEEKLAASSGSERSPAWS